MQKKTAAMVINISSMKAACKDCSLRELCLPLGLSEPDISSLDKMVKRRRVLKKGEMLYRFGDPLHSLYAIRNGALKTTGLIEDGRAQITGFYLPGELLGIDAINTDHHPCSAEALEISEVCEIPYASLAELTQKIPGLQHQLLRIMSREIVRDEEMLMMLGRMSAEARTNRSRRARKASSSWQRKDAKKRWSSSWIRPSPLSAPTRRLIDRNSGSSRWDR